MSALSHPLPFHHHHSSAMDEPQDHYYSYDQTNNNGDGNVNGTSPCDTDLDFSFNSTVTDRTFASSSARSSLARSSLTLSFNDRLSTASTPAAAAGTYSSSTSSLHHRRSDPHWSAIRTATNLSSDGRLHLSHLKLLRLLGAGNLGRVFLCQIRGCGGAEFALKVVDRDTLSKKKLSHVQMEAKILSMLDHPFLPTLYARIDVSHYTCLLIDYCANGDLHSLLRRQPGNRLPLSAAKFFAAEVVVALEYLHAMGIVYRDLKPENILIRDDGHVMLSDFDLCFEADVRPTFRRDRLRSRRKKGVTVEEMTAEFVAEPTSAYSRSCVGTHEYLSPELLTGNGHGNGVDWWAFGVLIYELIYGTTPFKGGSKESTLRNIASSKQVGFPAGGMEPPAATAAAEDLIGKLLVKDPRRRLGCSKGATDVKRHRFFEGINWPLIRHYCPPELRGLAVKGRARAGHVMTVTPRVGRSWWMEYLLRRRRKRCNGRLNLGSLSSSSNHDQSSSNCNYYRYKVRVN